MFCGETVYCKQDAQGAAFAFHMRPLRLLRRMASDFRVWEKRDGKRRRNRHHRSGNSIDYPDGGESADS